MPVIIFTHEACPIGERDFCLGPQPDGGLGWQWAWWAELAMGMVGIVRI